MTSWKPSAIGGGNGALLIGILNENPGLRGVVFDLPSAAERAKRRISESKLAERCQAIGGDFFKEVPSGGDAYLLKHVIHDWNDERALTILKSCHRAMGANGRLLIVEGIYPPRIEYVDSWVDLDYFRCFQVMRTEDRSLFEVWAEAWGDLAHLEIIPVRTSKEAAQHIADKL